MHSNVRRAIAVSIATTSAILCLTACSKKSSSDSSTNASTTAANAASNSSATTGAGTVDSSKSKVAFLMPDEASTRYELHDHPGFVTQMKKDRPACSVLYNDADGDASKQQQQFNAAITQGAKVIVLDAVDTTAAASLVNTAHSQGVKVVAYDRPIPSAKADFYVSFDNEKIGTLIAQSLVTKLKQGRRLWRRRGSAARLLDSGRRSSVS
jgi:D-xylose transport system substrate-binding protein